MANNEQHEIDRKFQGPRLKRLVGRIGEVARAFLRGGIWPTNPTARDGELAAAWRPAPSDPAEAALETFARVANWSHLHPEDIRRFDEFTAIARREGWLSTEVEARLVKLGLPEGLAQQLRRRYWNIVKPFPLTNPHIDQEIAKLNARLGVRRGASVIEG